METPLPFPELIDNTCRSMFVTCPQKWVYGNLNKLASRDPSIHLHAGGAFAYALETARRAFFDDGKSPAESLKLGAEGMVYFWGDFEAPEDSAKSLSRMLEAYFEYFIEYPLDTNPVVPMAKGDGTHAIEFTFSVPLPYDHPVTGNPLMYAGRFDMLAIYNDTLFAVDEKTASQLGSQWMNQWDLDSQFTGYCLIPGTEVLTPSGWLPIEQVTPYTQVMQWDQGRLTFTLPTALHSPQHQGDLYELSGKTHSITTATHRQLTFDTYTQKYKTFTTETLPMTSGALRLISAGHKQEGLPLPVDFMRLLVAFQADGSWKDETAMSFHFTKLRKALRLEEILNSLCIPFTKHDSAGHSYRIGKNEESSQLVMRYLGKDKLFDSWLLGLSGESLQAFITELQFWDGTSRGTRGWMYFTTVEQNAQWVQTIAALTGHYSSRHEQAGWKSSTPHIRINITENCQHSLHLHTKTPIPYSGKVYCLTVPSSYFLIRSQGKISVTGNCWAANQFGYPVGGAIIRGISILKTKFGHAQAIIYRPQWQLDRWYQNLCWDIEQMLGLWDRANSGKFIPQALDKSLCGQYGGCAYRKLCISQNPEPWIAADFVPRTWNPLAKGV